MAVWPLAHLIQNLLQPLIRAEGTERRVSSVQLAVDCPEILKLDAMESDAVQI